MSTTPSFTSEQVRHLRTGVRGVLVFGIATSVTANVIHSLISPHQYQWQIWAASILSGLAPVVLFAAMEMVTRIPVHSPVLGWIRLVTTAGLAGMSGWVSYSHMVAVSRMLEGSDGSEYIYPILIDGVMVVATISLIELGRIADAVRAAEQAKAEQAATVVTAQAATPRKRAAKAAAAAPVETATPAESSGSWYPTRRSAAPAATKATATK